MNKELNIFLDELEKMINKSFKKIDDKITTEDIQKAIDNTRKKMSSPDKTRLDME